MAPIEWMGVFNYVNFASVIYFVSIEIGNLWKMTGVGAAYPLTEMEEEVMGYFVYHRDDKT